MNQTPGGVHKPSWDGFNSGVEKSGWTKTAKQDTKFGEIYVCEKFEPNDERVFVWKVWWLARDMACELECHVQSSQSERTKEAVANALMHLRDLREPVYKEF